MESTYPVQVRIDHAASVARQRAGVKYFSLQSKRTVVILSGAFCREGPMQFLVGSEPGGVFDFLHSCSSP
jgi:hypothetical protein